MSAFYNFLSQKSRYKAVLALFLCVPSLVFAKIPNDPGYVSQESMWKQIGAPAAWDKSVGTKKVTVAVIDTGVDIWHDDLRDNVWHNTYEISSNGIDDDGNGYVDDVDGWNFVDNNNNVRPSVFDTGDDTEAVRHGTIAAGLIGAVGDNDRNGTGVNWHVQIMALRAVDSHGGGSFAKVAQAVDYAVKNGADVISMSFVGEKVNPRLRESLWHAYQQGVVIVAAAGNNAVTSQGDLDVNPVYPACLDGGEKENWILGVTAVNDSDQLSDFADFGSCVDVVAPGENIFSTERYAPQYGYPNSFGGGWLGTSFATPLVAGAAGLIKSIHPEWKAAQIIKVLLDSADSIDFLNPDYKNRLGRGRLNTGAAVAAALKIPADQAGAKKIVYSQGTHFYLYDVASGMTTPLASIPVGTVLSMAATYDTPDRTLKIITLISHDRKIYLRLLNEDGSVWKQVLIPKKNGGMVIDRLRVAPGKDGVARIFIAERDDARGMTIFHRFSLAGENENDLMIKRAIKAWGILDDVDSLAVGYISNSRMMVDVYQDGERAFHWERKKITSLGSFETGAVIDGKNKQVIMVAHEGKIDVELILNTTTGQVRRIALSPTKKTPGALIVVDQKHNGVPDVGIYRKESGAFILKNAEGEIVGKIEIPVFDTVAVAP